jgi:type II secretory pathway pseudopilin PulG
VENLKKKSVRAYLLLESLITLGLLGILVTSVLTEVVKSRQQLQEDNQQIEALNVAKMALNSQLTELSVNGASIKVEQTDDQISITNRGKELLELERTPH